MANEEKLDPKHRKFLDLYLETGNIADSYVGAGYQCSSDSACAGGSRLLRKLDEELNHLEVFLKRRADGSINRKEVERVNEWPG